MIPWLADVRHFYQGHLVFPQKNPFLFLAECGSEELQVILRKASTRRPAEDYVQVMASVKITRT